MRFFVQMLVGFSLIVGLLLARAEEKITPSTAHSHSVQAQPNGMSVSPTTPSLGTQANPLVVKSLEDPNAGEVKEGKFAKMGAEATLSQAISADRSVFWSMVAAAIAALAAVIGILQYRLFKEQLGLMASQISDGQKAIKIAQESSDSAKAAIESSIRMESPYIYANIPEFKLDIKSDQNKLIIDPDYHIGVCIYNHGRTPAVINKFQYTVLLLATGVEPQFANTIWNQGSGRPTNTVSVNGAPHLENINLPSNIMNDARNIQSGAATLWIHGAAEYSDVFGEVKTRHFCYFYSRSNRAFCQGGDSRLNGIHQAASS